MAAYASLVSVMHIIEKLHLHPRPPISLDEKQVDSLTEKISFLQQFLEAYNPHLGYSTEADPLEIRIADAAYAAEDLIESHIVDHITNENISSNGLCECLEKVIQEMGSIQKEAMNIRDKMGAQFQLHTNAMPPLYFRSTSIMRNSSMVGVDDVLLQIKDNLTSNSHHLEIIPIVGKGGTGKTTLASNVYQDPLIQEHFHVYAWATISQEYNIPDIFSEILFKLQNNEVSQHLSEDELGGMLHKHLFGRKYLVVMDDMWNIEAWEKVRRYFPNNENGSRIVITTRLSNLASEITCSNRLEMRLLDEEASWDLLFKTIFGENGCCPRELKEIGKKIAKSCKGLPLSIVVIGGLLAKSNQTREFWENIEENLSSIVNSVEDESCLRILHMSYKQLPIYLKPCFLYMGVFREDEVIRVSRLTKLWVAEGFLKPIEGKSLEEIAKEYLNDLTDRNLILTQKMGSTGSIKECKIHDMLRELCIREAEKERFYIVARHYCATLITQRRIVISNTSQMEAIDAVQLMSVARSLTWDRKKDPPSLNLRLMRVFESSWHTVSKNMFHLVNLRYLGKISMPDKKSLASLSRLWNLETLTLYVSTCSMLILPEEIWCMPHIRRIVGNIVRLPDPPSGSQNDIILGNLHTLVGIFDFKCSEEVVKRIPNLKKLGITYYTLDGRSCLNNLVCLHKLVSLKCSFFPKMPLSGPDSLNFPQSLKKLKLGIPSNQYWQGILEKIATLPLLEKLTLDEGCFKEGKWETSEAQFHSLKYLQLLHCRNLKEWTMESSHFPRLEHLVLSCLHGLEEIPLEVAEIPTLGSITLVYCKESAAISVRRIVEEQEESYGEAIIQVLVIHVTENEAVKSLATHRNIRVKHIWFVSFIFTKLSLVNTTTCCYYEAVYVMSIFQWVL